MTGVSSPVGRRGLLDQLTALRSGRAGSICLYGPAGIGKSTVLAAAEAEAVSSGGLRVLRAAATELESGLPYLTLVDLFDRVNASELARIPRHLRGALDGALRRGPEPTGPPDPLAVRLAVLELLRSLAADQPVLIIVDDLQWVDEQSAEVLQFAARRLNGSAVGMLAAERVEAGLDPVRSHLCPPPCVEIPIEPLTEYDLADLLRERYGPVLSLVTIARIHDASAGNPLFALELGRALVPTNGRTAPAQPLPVTERVRRLLVNRVAQLPAADAHTLVVVAAAARPTRAVVPDPARLDRAVEAGLLRVGEGGTVAFTHPLLREVVYAEASPADRAAAHQVLAERLADPVEQARHLALSCPYADAALAHRLEEAAGVANRRGAPAIAAELAALAAERTPATDGYGLAARRLAMAEHAYAAGLTDEAVAGARLALTGVGDPAVRVRAQLLLVDVAGQDQSSVGPLLQAATAEAGDDPHLAAKVGVYRASKAYYDGDIEGAVTELKQAEQAAGRARDDVLLVDVLATRATFEASRNGSESDDLLYRAAGVARTLPLTAETIRARQLAAMSRAFRGDVAEASAQIEQLRLEVERTGLVREYAGVLISVAGVHGRAGRFDQALESGRECMRLLVEMEPTAGPGLLVGANVELTGGSPERAGQLARQAVDACRAAGDDDWLTMALAVAGQVELLRGDAPAAATWLREASTVERRYGRTDPAVFLWHADLVEALASTGARAEAEEELAAIRATAERLGRRTVRLGLDRAEATLLAADDPIAGAQHLAAAIERESGHPYPFELARAWHAVGLLWRRANRRGVARAALAEARQRYAATRAVPWLRAVELDLSRVDGGSGMRLSEAEHRIVRLVMAGSTNGEIARAMFLSVKAVEATLTRLYRRLGVRNRAQLVQVLHESEAGADAARAPY